jgi:hypothetical protein
MKDALAGELSGENSGFFAAHLKNCSDCRFNYRALEATVRIVEKPNRRQPDQEFWEGYWDRLAERMEREKVVPRRSGRTRQWVFRLFPPRSAWIWGSAAAAGLILFGVFLGRVLFQPDTAIPPRAEATSPVAGAPSGFELLSQTRDYVRRSQILLTAIVNFDPAAEDPYSLDLAHRQRISNELIAEAARLKPALDETRSRRLQELVGDLEVVLLQLANLEKPGLADIDLIRAGVESRGILFKIYLIETDAALWERPLEQPNSGASKVF